MESVTDADIVAKFPHLEILNSNFTERYTTFAFQFITDKAKVEDILDLDLKNRKIPSWKVQIFGLLKKCRSLNIKGNTKLESNAELGSKALSIMPCLNAFYVDADYQAAYFANYLKHPHVRTINSWPSHVGKAPSFAEMTASQIFEKMWLYVESYSLPNYSYPLYCMFACTLLHVLCPYTVIIFRFDGSVGMFNYSLW